MEIQDSAQGALLRRSMISGYFLPLLTFRDKLEGYPLSILILSLLLYILYNQLPLSTIYVWKQESGSVSTGLQNGESGGTAVASSVNGNGSNNSRFESRIKYDIKAAAMRQGAFYYQVSLPHYRYGH